MAVRAGQVQVGDPIPPVEVADVDPEWMKTIAALMHDPNPIHWDAESVRRNGLGEAVINQGPSNMAYVMNALNAWTGDPAALRSIRMRFNGNVLAGETVVATGEVTAVEPVQGGALVTCEVWLARGEDRVVAGTASVQVPD